MRRNDPQRVVYGITSSLSVVLLEGQLRFMQTAGLEVHLVCSPGDGVREFSKTEGAQFHPLVMARDISPVRDAISLFSWLRLLWRLRPGIVNASTPKAGLLAMAAAWATRVPRRVYVLRGLRLEGADGVQAKLLWAAERLAIGFATDVIAVSDSLRKALNERHLIGPERPCVVIRSGSSNGVDADRIDRELSATDRASLRAELGIDESVQVVCFIGRLATDKGLGDLASAMARPELEGAILLTRGEFEDHALREPLSSLGARWIHMDSGPAAPALAVADVLCLPTYREGFPNAVLDAAVAGVPAVTTTATGAIDSVIDGQTGLLVEPHSASELARALSRVLRDPGLRDCMGRAARERARADFRPIDIWRGVHDVMTLGVETGSSSGERQP